MAEITVFPPLSCIATVGTEENSSPPKEFPIGVVSPSLYFSPTNTVKVELIALANSSSSVLPINLSE